MEAIVINALAVIAGGAVGIIFRKKIKERFTSALVTALALVVVILGIMNAIKVTDILGMIICIAVGVILGEWIDIEKRLDSLGNRLKNRFAKNGGENFTQAFVSASALFCVGSMTIIGSLQIASANDPTIILSKSVIDGITAVSFGAALGAGVLFSALSVFVYQGLLTLLALFAAPYLSETVILQMSAVGGVMLIGIALNMLEIKRIRVANMLPALFLPILYELVKKLIG